MCDIGKNKWDNVLLEWANCLQISKNIDVILDFRNGDFFNKLLILLSNRKVPIQDTIQNVYKFLNITYPNFHPLYRQKQLIDLEKPELRVVASLLMHYACIFDRRDDLTSPLCYKLSEEVQLYLKTFLENMTPTVTNSNLEKIIKECITKDYPQSRPGSYEWQNCGDSPLTHKSPLQDFLRTPIFKSGRMQEKDNEIKKLKSALEMQKYEKEDLLIELKEHKEKIKKISREVTAKTIEVSKLSSELLTLENRTPPHKPRALQEIERHLRAELQNAQKYISQLQEEIDELENSKEDIISKQKKSEEETCLWQDRALTTETKYELLTSEHKEQALELNSLRMNYNELSSLLEELRSSKHANDSCIEMDFSQCDVKSKSLDDISITEEYACTVVEVQLRDVQNQNDDLNMALKSAADRSVDLENGLKQVKDEYNSLLSNFEGLVENNKEMEAQVKQLQESQINMEIINQELVGNVEKLTRHNFSQSEELVMVQKSLNATKLILSERDLFLSSVQNDFKLLQNSHDELKTISDERNNQYIALENESHILQISLKDAVQNFSKKEFEYESLTKLYSELDENIELNLKKLVSYTLKDEAIFNYQNKSNAFHEILKELDIKRKADNEEKNNLCIEISTYEKLVAELEIEISNLKGKEQINIQLHNELNEHFNQANLHSKELKAKVEDYTIRIESSNRIINELNLTIQDLENLKVITQEQSITIQEHENTIQSLKLEIADLEQDIKLKKTEEERVSIVVKEMEIVKSNLENEILRKAEEIEVVKLKMQNDLLNESKMWENVKISLDKDFMMKSQELEMVKTDLGEELVKNEELRSIILNLQNDLLDKNQELSNQLRENEEKSNEIKNLERRNNDLQRNNEEHLGIIKNLENTNINLGNKNEQYFVELKQLEEQNMYLGCQNQEHLNEIENLANRTDNIVSKHISEIHDLEKKLINLGNKNESHVQEIIDLNNLNFDLEKKNEGQLVEIEDFVGRYEKLDNELIIAKETIEAGNVSHAELQQKYDIYNKKSLEEINKLNIEIVELVARTEALEISLTEANDDCIDKSLKLENSIQQLVNAEKQFEGKETEFKQKINVLEDTVLNFKLEVANISNNKIQLDKEMQEQFELQVKLEKTMKLYEEKFKSLESDILKLSEHIAKKEKMCLEQDDVLSKTNTELLQLKLLLERKQQRIEDLNAQSEALLSKNIESTTIIESLTNQRLILENDALALNDKIKIMREHKIELKKKAAELEANTSNYIHQLAVKNDEMDLAIKNLKIYKEETSNELEYLKSLIVEATHKLEQVNEDRVTLTSNYQKVIKETDNKIMFLEKELDVLRTREIGYLQEISMIKDELTETISKYTDALQIKDELRLDNESQISRLTENIHEMVEKYNILDQELVNVVLELKKTKICLQEMEEIKHNYEMQLVQQKHKYEEDFMAAADQYKSELEGLVSTQSKLLLDIEKYASQLEDEHSNRSIIEIKLEKAESDLRIVGEEKNDLLFKIEEVIKTNRQLEKEYSTLQIENEDYLKESKVTLSNTQCKLEEAVEKLEELRTDSAEQIENLKQSVQDLKEEMVTKQTVFAEEVFNRNAEIGPLNNRVKELENHVITLENAKEQIRVQIETTRESYDGLKNNYMEKQDEIIQLQSAISKLQCAYDILNTGRQNVDAEYAELTKTCEHMKIKLHENELTHIKEIEELQLRIKELETSIEDKQSVIEENEMKLKIYNDEAETIKKIVETMQMEKDEIEFDRVSLRTRLSIIEEDHDNKIKEEIDAFNAIKERYDVLIFDKGIIEQHCDELNKKLATYSEEKDALERIVKENEDTKIKLIKQFRDANTFLEKKDGIIESLQKEMGIKLELLETISKDKAMLEHNLQMSKLELGSIKQSRDDILETHSKLLKDTENILLKAHNDAMEVKNNLLIRLETSENEMKNQEGLKNELDQLLQQEKSAKEFFEVQVLELKNEQFVNIQVLKKLKESIKKLGFLIHEKPIEINDDSNYEILNEIILDTEKRVVEIYTKKRELNDLITKLEKDKIETISKINDLEKCNDSLSSEKIQLLENYEILHHEKVNLSQQKEKESKCLENLQTEYELLKNKYDEMLQHEDSLNYLKQKNIKNYNDYQDFVAHSKIIKQDIDRIVLERNSLETIVGNLKENYLNVQIKAMDISEDKHKLYYEQKHTLEIIFDDIQKQFNRLSKIVYNTSVNTAQIFEKTVTGILTEKPVGWELLFKALNIEETLVKLEDLKDNAGNTLEQMKAYEKSIDALNIKQVKPKVLKENVSVAQKPKDDDWKKKYMAIKQRLTLIENAKNNYEKKLKQLREDIKTLTQADNKKVLATQPLQVAHDIDNDIHYKALLQQHVQAKEDHERLISQYDTKYKNIIREFEEYKLSHSNKIIKADSDKEMEVRLELQNLRSAYGGVMSDNARLDMENATLRQLLDDRNKQLGGLQLIKEAYEKLFEENNKLMQNIDTIKYKRNRDREEYVRLLKKEKEDGDAAKKIQEVRTEYEVKLTKMKGKMVELYHEEIERQVVEKSLAEKEENKFLTKTIDQLRQDLRAISIKLQAAERERNLAHEELRALNRAEREANVYSSRESVASRTSLHGNPRPSRDYCDSRLSRNSTQSLGRDIRRDFVEDSRRYSTLPKNVTGMDVIEEVRFCRRTSINSIPPDIERDGMEMEDEGDLFNNKYLTDLKEGRCPISISNGRESNASRLSELVYRNSLCPPHLKSSYPAETQFNSPNNFNEHDIKSGILDFDDSMSTRLLPGEKRKKDAGTTSYKRPGPPTPSKHGGRSSLQGNEFHLREPLKENVDKKSPKKSTPNRLKALFSRSSVKDSSENQQGTPKAKRLSIFRKPR